MQKEQPNKRWHLDKLGAIQSTEVLKEKLTKILRSASSLMIAKGRAGVLGGVCWQCDQTGIGYLRNEEKYRKVVIYCYKCGRYYLDRFDITDYEHQQVTENHERSKE